MGVRYVDECVGCPPEMGCLGSSCPNRGVARYYCDDCGEEFCPNELYHFEDEMLCINCLVKQFAKVGG